MANEYAKVILYAYPHLLPLADAVGVGAVNKAMLSFRAREDALVTAEAIAEELAFKSRLLRLAEDLEGVLASFGDEEMYLLEYKYFRRGKVLRERYAGYVMACSERTYFRRQAAVLHKFCCLLAARGWTERAYAEAFGGFAPFARVLDAILSGRESAVTAKRKAGRGASA